MSFLESPILEQKAWGTALHIFNNPNVAVSVLTTVAGGYSSKHWHKARVNRFVVLSGAIDVIEYDPKGRTELHRQPMKSGDLFDVQPGVVHRFEVRESGQVIEVYWPAEVRLDDITRLDTGGADLTGVNDPI